MGTLVQQNVTKLSKCGSYFPFNCLTWALRNPGSTFNLVRPPVPGLYYDYFHSNNTGMTFHIFKRTLIRYNSTGVNSDQCDSCLCAIFAPAPCQQTQVAMRENRDKFELCNGQKIILKSKI